METRGINHSQESKPEPVCDGQTPSEWEVVAEDKVQRQLRGSEIFVNYTEEKYNGSFQLSYSVDLVSNQSASFFKAHFATVIYLLRQRYPEVAVELPPDNLDVASFSALRTVEQAKNWLAQSTRLIEDGSTVDEVMRRLNQQVTDAPNKINRFHLVIHPRSGNPGVVSIGSHAVAGLRNWAVLGEIAELYMTSAASKSVEEVFVPESLSTVIPRLPQSLIKAYHDKFKPGDDERDIGYDIYNKSATRNALPTVGVPVTPQWRSRSSKAQHLHECLDAQTAHLLRASIKKERVTFTAALYAAVVAAIVTHYPENADKGAHVVFSGNGRRWVPTEGENGSAPIGMTVVPGGFYVDAKENAVRLDARSRSEMVPLAHAIGKHHMEDLESPHLLSVYDDFVCAWREDADGLMNEEPTFSKPTVTSQGKVRDMGAKNDRGDFVQVADFGYAGRTTVPEVCFSSHAYQDRLHLGMSFDERFFPLEDMRKLFTTFMSRILTFAISGPQPSHL